MPSVLFVCTHNSARSQMAEGLLRHFWGERFEALSAGTEATRVHPQAVRTMAELGIDISGQRSKGLADLPSRRMDFVVTVCDRAREACPYVPARIRGLHASFDDPASMSGDEALRLAAFRRVRDEIREWLARLVPELEAAVRGEPSGR